jgi:two-component system CheB/CheR fusion protein
LIQELQHRIKNMLAVVRSLAHRTRSNSRSLEDFSAHFDGRLAALAHVQTALARSPVGAVDLENLVREELLKSAGEVDDAVMIDGPDIGLKGRTAELMAMALHELAANAVKFGSLSSEAGRLSVSWRIEPSDMGRRLRLDWFEGDIGPVAPSSTGFGFELLRQGLPYELGAEVDIRFEEGDFRCVIETPLADEAVG